MIPSPHDDFTLVGLQPALEATAHRPKRIHWSLKGKPIVAFTLLVIIILGCLFSPLFINHDPAEFYLMNVNQAPNSQFYFGTDSLGRDIYSIIWYGGRASLLIGLFSAIIIWAIGITYGCISGMAAQRVDQIMMHVVELLQSVPTLLMLLLLSSLMTQQNVISMSVIIGMTGWFPLARMVRSEVRIVRNSEYIYASKRMGASVFHIIIKHLIPNVLSPLLFMLISNISMSMLMESTLSFLGLGLPIETLSWGSMLALANRALLMNTWWVIIFPGMFLVITFLCITSIGHYFRHQTHQGARTQL